jgi:hypothetical protein
MKKSCRNVSLILLLSPIVLPAQHVRDDWKYLAHPFDLEAVLDHSLADAPLRAEERAQIYKLIDDKTVHDSFRDNQREEEHRTVLDARVGWITLAEDGGKQMVVRGPKQFCGANWNCSIWVFVRQGGKLRLVLSTGGNTFMIEKSSAYGFRAISTFWHMGADEGVFAVYRWDGAEYKEADCYDAKFDLDHRDRPPVTTDCPSHNPFD